MLKCTLSKFTKKMTESTWNLPNKLIEEPSLKVYNSLSRSKVCLLYSLYNTIDKLFRLNLYQQMVEL